MRIPTTNAILGTALLCAGTAFAEEGLRPGVQAPDFTLKTIQQQTVSMKEAVAKGTVVLHFWKSK